MLGRVAKCIQLLLIYASPPQNPDRSGVSGTAGAFSTPRSQGREKAPVSETAAAGERATYETPYYQLEKKDKRTTAGQKLSEFNFGQ